MREQADVINESMCSRNDFTISSTSDDFAERKSRESLPCRRALTSKITIIIHVYNNHVNQVEVPNM